MNNATQKTSPAVLVLAAVIAVLFPIGVWSVWKMGTTPRAGRAVAAPPAATPSVVAEAADNEQGATPGPDAGASEALLLMATHSTCGTGFVDPDGGVVFNQQIDGGWQRWTGRLACSTPDGGIVWTMEAEANILRRAAAVTAHVYAAEAAVNPAGFRAELRTMDRESASGDSHWALPGLLFRAPERSVGKFVRIEGAAQEVREDSGETTLTIALDMLGRERIDITYPGIASDRVVNGAEVVVYGIVTGSSAAETRRGEQVVPEVMAVHIEPVAEGTAEQQTRRMLRRVRRY